MHFACFGSCIIQMMELQGGVAGWDSLDKEIGNENKCLRLL